MNDKLLEYLEARWGPPVRQGLGWYEWHCLWCEDTYGKFRVWVRDDGSAGAKCIRCGRPGKGEGLDLYGIIAEQEGVSRGEIKARLVGIDHSRAQEKLSELFRRLDPKTRAQNNTVPENVGDLPESPPPVQQGPPVVRRPRETPEMWSWWDQTFPDVLQPVTVLGLEALNYLFARGIPRRIIEEFHIRYAEDRVGLGSSSWETQDGRKVPPIQTIMHGRVMFPVINRGKLVFFQGRDFLDREAPTPRYWSSKRGRDTEYGAGEVLFGLDSAWGRRTVIIVEGPMDFFKVHMAIANKGMLGVVALMGHGMTIERIQLLKEAHCKNVILWYDLNLGKRERLVLFDFVHQHFPTLWTQSQTNKKDAGECTSTSEVLAAIGAAKGMSLLDKMGL